MHPYFVGTQAHPCLSSRPLGPDGLFQGLVMASLARAYPQQVIDVMESTISNVAVEAESQPVA